nr:uncharacterized mitochondrial protein AtMg00810-like [Tanacetum cinerariifolium]
MHITFLKNKPMIAGGRPEWLFGIDSLSESMNYAPVSAGTNSNDFASKGAIFDADLDGHNKDKHCPSQESKCDNQERPNVECSTKHVNIAGPNINTANANDNTGSLNINTVSPPVNIATPTYADYSSDPFMPNLEDAGIFDDAYNDRDMGTEADYNNLKTVDQQKDGIFLSQDKYVCDILKKFGFSSVKSASTPMETHKPLSKDANGTDVDVHLYRSMICSLMYLASSRPDIMFVVCACSRFQVQLKVSHMHTVKRIFRYLNGQPTLGLWYLKDSPLELIAYSDSDYTVTELIRWCFPSWISSTQQMVINLRCLIDKKELAIPGKTTTGKEFSNPLMAGSLPKTTSTKFWNTASSKTINFVKQIHAIVDGKAVVISESSVRSDILFDVEDGGGDSVERAITTDASLEVAHDSDNILKTQTTSMPNVDIPQGVDTGGSPKRQETMGGGYTPGSVEGGLKLEEMMNICTTLSNRVKKLETQLKKKKSRAVIHSSNEEEPSVDIEDSPKHGRMIEELDQDEDVNLVNEQGKLHETAEPLKDDDDATLAEYQEEQLDKREEDVDKGDQTQEIDWNDPTMLRYHALQNRAFSKAKDSLIEKEVIKRSGFHLQQESSKKQKLDEQIDEEVKAQVNSDQEVKEMKLYIRIVPDEEIAIDAIPLATKPLVIVEYKIVKKGKISNYHIIRVDGSTKKYTSMIKLLENINREDLETL